MASFLDTAKYIGTGIRDGLLGLGKAYYEGTKTIVKKGIELRRAHGEYIKAENYRKAEIEESRTFLHSQRAETATHSSKTAEHDALAREHGLRGRKTWFSNGKAAANGAADPSVIPLEGSKVRELLLGKNLRGFAWRAAAAVTVGAAAYVYYDAANHNRTAGQEAYIVTHGWGLGLHNNVPPAVNATVDTTNGAMSGFVKGLKGEKIGQGAAQESAHTQISVLHPASNELGKNYKAFKGRIQQEMQNNLQHGGMDVAYIGDNFHTFVIGQMKDGSYSLHAIGPDNKAVPTSMFEGNSNLLDATAQSITAFNKNDITTPSALSYYLENPSSPIGQNVKTGFDTLLSQPEQHAALTPTTPVHFAQNQKSRFSPLKGQDIQFADASSHAAAPQTAASERVIKFKPGVPAGVG